MSTRTLGLIGIVCSPSLALQLKMYGAFGDYKPTSMVGLLCFIYMTGWLCSVIGLYKLKAAGKKKFGKIILIIQIVFLIPGDISNIYCIIQPATSSELFQILDLFWPVSNMFMLITGLAVFFAKQLSTWKRTAPLIVGLWFPLTIVISRLVFGTSLITVNLTCYYSVLAWSMLGLAVYCSSPQNSAENSNPIQQNNKLATA